MPIFFFRLLFKHFFIIFLYPIQHWYTIFPSITNVTFLHLSKLYGIVLIEASEHEILLYLYNNDIALSVHTYANNNHKLKNKIKYSWCTIFILLIRYITNRHNCKWAHIYIVIDKKIKYCWYIIFILLITSISNRSSIEDEHTNNH